MAVKKIVAKIKLQLPAGKAVPGSKLGSSIGIYGVNIVLFLREFNDISKQYIGNDINIILIIYTDKTFNIKIKGISTVSILKQVCALEKGNTTIQKKVARKKIFISNIQIDEVTKIKMMNKVDEKLFLRMRKMIIGTAKSMGLIIEEEKDINL